MKGSLYLIPVPLAEGMMQTLPAEVATHTARLTHYFAEDARTARRFLRAMHATMALEPIQISEIDKHSGIDAKLLRQWLKEGHDVGVMSEAGCPGIADPGAGVVAIAHGIGAKVIPLTGPNSLILALMASGLNGQSFAFNGYIPVKEPARSKRIKELEAISKNEKQTQLFIETPYRNDQFLAELLKHLQPYTRVCVAMNLTTPDSYIKTMTVAEWKKGVPKLGKIPAVFLVLC